MKRIILLIFTCFAYSSIALAGSGHDHSHGHSHGHGHSHASKPIDKEKAQKTGKNHVDRLIKSKKLDSSWGNANFEKAETKMFGKKKEWVVTFLNDKGVKGKKLYVFLSENGEFIAANFTGK